MSSDGIVGAVERTFVPPPTMHAATLPLELLLQIFALLDAKSFFAARKACKWWRLASQDPVTLRRLLETLPVLPPVTRESLNPHELQYLSTEASRVLMLEWLAREEPEQGSTLLCAPAEMPTSSLSISFSSQARRLATFDGAQIRLFDTSATEWKQVVQRPLETRLGKGLWLKSCPSNSCKMSLASYGHLLAIAFKTTIQIYDLSSDSGRCEVIYGMTMSTDQYITGLEFEQHDHLLRVHLSPKGSVVYFGSPPRENCEPEKADFEHWCSVSGLQNRFLDSSLLSTAVEGVSGPSWLSGVQALHSLYNGYLFAAQRHGGGESSRYAILHAKFLSDPAIRAPQIDHSSTTEIARLESFLSSLDFGTGGLARHDIGIWEDMPSAHESCPKFGITPDRTMLLLAEREKKRVWPSPTTQLFVYRLPSQKRIASLLQNDGEKRDSITPSRHRLPAMPLCLGTVQGRCKNITSEQSAVKARSYQFTVMTDEITQSWRIDGV